MQSLGHLVFLFGNIEEALGRFGPRGPDHTREEAILASDSIVIWVIDQKFEGTIVLYALTICHNQDAISINHRSQSVSDNYDRGGAIVHELLTKLRLDKVVRLKVNIGSRLVQDKNFRAQKHCSRKTDELFLTNRKDCRAF